MVRYLPETDELMYSFLAPRYGGYWNVTREQRVGVFRGPEDGPLVNANPGEFEMWMRGINVGIWDAVEKAILVLMEGWPGFEHPTNYYYNGEYNRTLMYFYPQTSPWTYRVLDVGPFNNDTKDNIGFTGYQAMYIDYETDEIFMAGQWNAPGDGFAAPTGGSYRVEVRDRSEPSVVKRFVDIENPFTDIIVPSFNTVTHAVMYGVNGYARDYETDTLYATTRTEGASPDHSMLCTVDFDNARYENCAEILCDDTTDPSCSAYSMASWGTNGIVILTPPTGSITLTEGSRSDNVVTVHMRWTIPPADPLTSIPSSLVVTNGNLQAVRQVGPQEFELDVLGTGSSVTVTMPANQAGVYAHEERSLEMADFGPVELIFNIILERASLGFSLTRTLHGTVTVPSAKRDVGAVWSHSGPHGSDIVVTNGLLRSFTQRDASTYDFEVLADCDGLVTVAAAEGSGFAGSDSAVVAACLISQTTAQRTS